jgi:phosphomannomutase
MVTASHNEPEHNGLKFIVDGKGIGQGLFDQVVGPSRWELSPLRQGAVKHPAGTRYVDDLVKRFGEGSCEGVKVALDLGGGAAISHAIPLLRRLGCVVSSVNDSPGVFTRRVDPTADDLGLLRRVVKAKGCDVGFGFDCDGDRLVIVDDAANKRTGDYMLTLALAEMLAGSKEKTVVVSVDTTQAVDLVAEAAGAKVLRSRVGEANVVSKMLENGARLGGEGSSGGLIDGSFNYCRDSLLAALTVVRALKMRGRKAYGEVKSFQQSRVAVQVQRTKAARAIKTLAAKSPGADLTDGVKIWPTKRSWVLIRVSGTEDVTRVSAEAETASKAAEAARTYAAKLKELCK